MEHRMTAPDIPDCLGAPPPTAPRQPLPPGACDTHLHVLGPYARYPLAPDRAYTVPEAPLSALRDYMRVTGLSRVVIAHVSAAGRSLDVTLDAMEELGDAARGTVMVTPAMTARDIGELHGKGMRGARLSHAFGDAITADALRELAGRIADHGWHIAIWPQGAGDLEAVAAAADDLPVPVVLDHLAGHAWTPGLGLDQPGFALLRRLLSGGRVWMKISGMYRASPHGYPWPELKPFMAALVGEAPERLLWASDWPHVGMPEGPMPGSGEMLDWLADIGATGAAGRTILVDNPASLYGFGPG